MARENNPVEKINDVIERKGLIKVPVTESKDGLDSPYRRVAKFLLLIGVDEAAKILPFLPPEQTEKIIPEIASIRSVDSEEALVILAEFQSLREKAKNQGGVDTARTILEKAYGTEKADLLLKKAVPLQGEEPFVYMKELSKEQIYLLIKNESAAVKALVLSHISPKSAADIINNMGVEEKKETVLRLAKMGSIDQEVLHRVDQSMREKVRTLDAPKDDAIDGRGALADILKRMDINTEGTILSVLEDYDSDLTADLRKRLFTIDDFLLGEDAFIQKHLRTMKDIDIAYLIADKEESFREKILLNVSHGRGDLILEEEQLHKPMRKKDCDDITNIFLTAMRNGFENGDLIIRGRNEEIYVD